MSNAARVPSPSMTDREAEGRAGDRTGAPGATPSTAASLKAVPAPAPGIRLPASAVQRHARDAERLQRLARNVLLPAITFALAVLAWYLLAAHVAPDLPLPAETWAQAKDTFSAPFHDHGPNDKGIGWQLLYSLGRVMAGFALAVLIGVPVGLLMGLSDTFHRAWNPLVQVLKPVSPLAWLPIGLLLFRAVDPSAIFVITITCIWPTLVNTAAGVKAIPSDYMNVARVLNLSRTEVMRRILLPATLPYILTGMRLSLGIAWMVIVAAEMLTGGIGIGFYIWDEWNNLNVNSIIVAIVVIGLVGILLESCMGLLQRRLDYRT